MKSFLISLLFSFCTAGFAKTQPPLPTATNVDIGRYIGKWYVVSALP